MKFKKWFEQNRDDLINAPNTETVSELTWRGAVEQTKRACAEAFRDLAASEDFIRLHPNDVADIIMQAEVE